MTPPSDDGAPSLVEVLQIGRHARIGVGVGVATAVLAYAVRIGALLGPVRDTRGGPIWFALLAVVLAISIAAFVTAVLTAWTAVSLARNTT